MRLPSTIVCFVLAFSILICSCTPSSPLEPSPTSIPTLPVVQTPQVLRRIPTCRAGTYDLELPVKAVIRKFRLHIPSRLQEPVALLIVLHGFGGDMAGIEKLTGMSPIADQNGFVVVYPQALGNPAGWNLAGSSNEDVDFIDSLINDLAARCPIDLGRVFAAGHSRGGGMANRLACDLDRRINSIAVVAGAMGYWLDCLPHDPVPVLAIHGLEDATVPFTGRPKLPGNSYGTPPLPEWAAQWAGRNGCSATPEKIYPTDLIQVETWSACRNGASVVLYSLAQGGHEWPLQPLNASQAIWDFFKKH